MLISLLYLRAVDDADAGADWQHGESQYNVEGKIGGDALLSVHGQTYAEALPGLIKNNIGDAPLTVRRFLALERTRAVMTAAIGLDVYIAADHPIGPVPSLSQAHVEVARRARCGCL